MDYEAIRLIQAMTNLLLAMNGEPPPDERVTTLDVADRLDLIARRLRLEHR